MEKVHAKSLKKAIKTGNVEQVEQDNRQEYQKLTREQDEKVPPNVALYEWYSVLLTWCCNSHMTYLHIVMWLTYIVV